MIVCSMIATSAAIPSLIPDQEGGKHLIPTSEGQDLKKSCFFSDRHWVMSVSKWVHLKLLTMTSKSTISLTRYWEVSNNQSLWLRTKPICWQATAASSMSKPYEQTPPQTPLMLTSNRPQLPLLSLTLKALSVEDTTDGSSLDLFLLPWNPLLGHLRADSIEGCDWLVVELKEDRFSLLLLLSFLMLSFCDVMNGDEGFPSDDVPDEA